MSETSCLVVSIVSHGHGALVQRLLEQMARESAAWVDRVVVTVNVPEPALVEPEQGWPFVLEVVHNRRPQGFGSNHNQALQSARESFVCVLNPDVLLLEGRPPFEALLEAAAQPGVGCAYPVQIDEQGRVQDSEREVPTPAGLWRRRVLRRAGRKVEWVNAACVVLPTTMWHQIGGFDTAYFMYCEDVDLCLRVRLAGGRLARAAATVVHAGQHASHRDYRHLRWHVSSLLRLWCSSVMWRARLLP